MLAGFYRYSKHLYWVVFPPLPSYEGIPAEQLTSFFTWARVFLDSELEAPYSLLILLLALCNLYKVVSAQYKFE